MGRGDQIDRPETCELLFPPGEQLLGIGTGEPITWPDANPRHSEMGTDTTERTIPCPCGMGEVLITTSTPDHAWISAYNVHHHIQILCRDCDTKFQVDDTRIVRRVDQARRIAAQALARATHDQFRASASVQIVKAAFGDYLDQLPSVAATYRLLAGNNLESYAIGTFRNNWRGGAAWAENHVGVWNLPKVLSLLGRDPNEFAAELRRIKDLDDAVPSVPTVMRCFQ